MGIVPGPKQITILGTYFSEFCVIVWLPRVTGILRARFLKTQTMWTWAACHDQNLPNPWRIQTTKRRGGRTGGPEQSGLHL